MAKFNLKVPATTRATSPITSTTPATTHQGGAGFAREAKSELFLLAVTNMVGEVTFYEDATTRDNRFEALVRRVAVDDPDWMCRFIPWLRGDANMRSAALVAAAEAVKARLDAARGTGNNLGDQMAIGYQTRDMTAGGWNRRMIDAACQRADEPGEMLGYWTSHYGRTIPKPVKRGVADAVTRLYNGKSLLKYDTDSKGYRFGDVVDLVHPTAAADKPWQGGLFRYALDRRHNREDARLPEGNFTLAARQRLMDLPVEARREWLTSIPNVAEKLAEAGMTWEALAGWLQGPMDAAAWEAVIPSMGIMALARNLRNFDQAGVSDTVAAQVMAKISDPEQVAKSRMFPFRWLSAYRAAPNLRWAWPLEQALNHSVANIPQLPGRTLILVDTSGSMHAGFSKDGTLMRWDAAALFGLALAARCEDPTVVSFSNRALKFPVTPAESVLKSLERFRHGFFQGSGTDTVGAVRAAYDSHDRVVILTDEQAGVSYGWGGRTATVDQAVPANIPLYTWNLAGYRVGHAPSGTARRHTFGGLTDQAFRMIPLLEAGESQTWPF